EGKNSGKLKIIFSFFGGIILLSFGAEIFVDGAVTIAALLGVSDLAIGMSIVAFGTSLPELSTSVMAAFHREHGISIGNIIGSNLFNILSVLGIASMLSPLDAPHSIFSMEIPFMIAFGLILIPISIMKQPISRSVSLFLIAGYITFLILLF
ncbi:MAG: sodium:calcium antiporter, partial [Candidatus Neomarinimicrobiota bacterium]